MARKITYPVQGTGQTVTGEPVEIEETVERPTMVKLSDGTTLRVKVDVIGAARIEGQWDNDGRPVYRVKSATLVAVLDSPEELHRKGH